MDPQQFTTMANKFQSVLDEEVLIPVATVEGVYVECLAGIRKDDEETVLSCILSGQAYMNTSPTVE